MDLFTIFLQSATGWGIGKTLDVITKCSACGEKRKKRIGNCQYNDVYCHNCKKEIEQYTNACDFTLNKSNRKIGHANIKTANYNCKWVNSEGKEAGFFDNFFGKKNKNGVVRGFNHLQLPFSYEIYDLKKQQIVRTMRLSDFDTNETIFQSRRIITPNHDKVQYGPKWKMSPKKITKIKANDIIAYDIEIKSTYGDLISEKRRLIKPKN